MREKYFIYDNCGSIDKVINDLRLKKGLRFSSLIDVFTYISKRSFGFRFDDLSLKPYGYDARIKKEVYMIVTVKCGKENYIKKYGSSQFAGYYLVEL